METKPVFKSTTIWLHVAAIIGILSNEKIGLNLGTPEQIAGIAFNAVGIYNRIKTFTAIKGWLTKKS